jgi:hypothetical protein
VARGLVVEDDDVTRLALEAVPDRAGHRVRTTARADQARADRARADRARADRARALLGAGSPARTCPDAGHAAREGRVPTPADPAALRAGLHATCRALAAVAAQLGAGGPARAG